MRDHRPVVEGTIYRLKKGISWRCLPPEFGAWQTVHRRHYRWSVEGTWDRVLARLQADADVRGELDWAVSVGSTVARAGLVRAGRPAARPAAAATPGCPRPDQR